MVKLDGVGMGERFGVRAAEQGGVGVIRRCGAIGDTLMFGDELAMYQSNRQIEILACNKVHRSEFCKVSVCWGAMLIDGAFDGFSP